MDNRTIIALFVVSFLLSLLVTWGAWNSNEFQGGKYTLVSEFAIMSVTLAGFTILSGVFDKNSEKQRIHLQVFKMGCLFLFATLLFLSTIGIILISNTNAVNPPRVSYLFFFVALFGLFVSLIFLLKLLNDYGDGLWNKLFESPRDIKYFYVCDGSVLKSLGELKAALKTMPDGVYNYHANRDDWAKWIEGVFGKKDLAKRASGADRNRLMNLL